MLVTNIFSFSHSVFQSLPLWGREKSGLCGKELNITQREKASEICIKRGEIKIGNFDYLLSDDICWSPI